MFATVALLITAELARAAPVFIPDADYRILTIYGVNTDIDLADYLAEGVTATFALKSCDTSRADYYSTASVTDGKLKLTSNTLGHVHGSNTQNETVCTVTGTAGSDSEDGVFHLYTVSDRTPPQLGALSLSGARTDAVDIQTTGVPASSYVRLGWRKSGGRPTFRVVSGVSSGTVLTIPNLDVNTEYEIRAYLMTRQSFDLYRSGDTGMPVTLISEGAPASKWITNLTGSGLGKTQTLNVTTAAALPTLSINDVTVTEAANAMAEFTVTLSAVSGQVVTVAYATSNGTAMAGSDYTSTSSTLTIPAGQMTRTITVPITDDAVDEPDEAFTVRLSAPSNATVADDEGTGTITDNDDPPTLRINDVTVAEASGATAVFTVTLSAVSGQTVTVAYATSNGTAVAGSDYTSISSTLTMSAGQMTGTVSVPILDDAVDEPDETFMVRLSAPSNATVENDEGTGTITDNDDPPTLRINDVTVAEASGATAVFTVTLSAVSGQVVTVAYATSNGTAMAGSDYTSISSTLTMSAGQMTGTVSVPILDDALDEPDETFTVRLSNPGNARVEDSEGVGTITEDDLPPSLSIDDVTVAEAANAMAEFTVTLSAVSGQVVTVAYATSNGTAVAGSDYTSTSSTLTIPAGQMTRTITVPITDDAVDEPDEAFTVRLSAPSNATVADDEGTGTITDNDDPPTLRINDVTVVEASGATAVFTVTLSAVSGQTVTVAYATSNGTAVAGSDYTSISSTLTMSAGQMTGTVSVPILDDAVDEPDEAFTVRLSAPSNATVADDEGTGTITDNDDPPTLRINDVTVAEAANAMAEFTVTLSAVSGQVVTVAYATSNGTAVAGSDYTSTSSTLTMSAGQMTGTVSVPILDDALDEPDETFTVRLSNPGNARVEDSEGVGTITEDDLPPSLSIDDVTVAEASGATAVFTVTLSAVSGQVVTVAYATSNGTAMAGSDYTSTSSTLTIPAGQMTRTITVPITDDAVDEPDEAFTVRLSAPSNATVADDEGTGTITDNDDPPTLRINDVTVVEASGATAVFTVTLSAVSGQVVTVAYATSNGTAVAGSDYTSISSTLTMSAGQMTGTVSVPILDDAVDEPDETFMVRLSAPSNATVENDEGTGTITEDDPRLSPPAGDPGPTLRIEDATPVEEDSGTVAVFTVRLSAQSVQVVTVDYTTVDGTAVEDSDYTKTSGMLSIPAGEVSGMIRVPILDDAVAEPDETFMVTLGTPGNASVADGEGTGTITDDDYPAVTVSYEVGSYTVTEGEFIDVTVVLSAPPGRPVVVSVTDMPDGGAVETDYSGVPESVAFGPSETQKIFIFRAVEDAEYDDGEKVVLGFGILSSGVTASDPETSIVTIEDNDFAADAVPKQWLARFGRTAVVHVVDALDERMRWLAEPPRCPPGRPRWRCRPSHREPQSMVIGGHRLASGVNQTEAFEWYEAGQRRDEWMLYDGTLGDWDADAFRSLTVNEFLARSSFQVSSEEEEGWRLSFWGRGAFSRFDGGDGGLTLGGDVTTATLGADYAGDRWLGGVALSRSEGEGTFSRDGFEGEVASLLTGLYPYLRYGVSERLSIWGMVGYGSGTLTFTADDVESMETDIAMTMGAVGLRGELLAPADEKDFALTLKADALFVRTVSDVVPGLRAAEAEVNRLRLGIEGSWEFVSEDGQWLSPFIEAGLRHDGGDAETGLGVEIGAGLLYAHPEQYLTMELNARWLLAHDADGLAEWGVSGSLHYDPRPSSELGPSFTLSPSWGARTSGGVDALWKRADMAALAANDDAAPAGRIDAELAYGFAILDGRAIGTPLAGVSLSESGRAFRVGYRIGLAHREDLDFNLSLEGTRRENTRGGEHPEYGGQLRFSIRW